MKSLAPRPSDSTNRAVSNTVAFVLVFALIVTSVGLVTTVGLGSLQDVQQFQQAELSTGAIRAVGGGIGEIAAGERPAYRDSVGLGGGELAVVNETAIEVTVATGAGTVFDETYRPRTLRYTFEGRNTTYGSGVLARGGDSRRATLVSGPETIRCSPASDVAVVTLIELVPSGGTGVGGGPVTVDTRRVQSSPPATVDRLQYPTTRPPPTATNVTLTVSGPWKAAWREALLDRGFSPAGADTVSCRVSQVTVQVVRVRVELIT
jgi:hypothetical protein